MRSVLHLDLGAGPEAMSLGGLGYMRAPAQHHRRPAHAHPGTGWIHPYTGLPGIAVFYNDGGDGDPAPTPKPTPPAQPPAPTPGGQTFTQEDLERIAAKEKAQGQRSGAKQALEDLAKELGFTKPEDVKSFVAAARQAEEAKKTEEQKRQEELERREAELAQEKATIAAQKRTMVREQALTRLGAVDLTNDQGNLIPNLQDALAMLERDLRDEPDADPQTVAAAAAKLKARRPELFGASSSPAPSALPPAPGGAPAGGGNPKPAATKPGNRGLEMARLRGHIKKDAA